MTELGNFEGRDVIGTSMKVTRAGDGLSAAMALEPAIYHQGDEVTVVLRGRIGRVQFDEVKETDCLNRVHVLVASDITVVEEASINKILDAEKARLTKLREEAQGVSRLPGADGVELRGEHVLGNHREGGVEGCGLCEEEASGE